jgi:hypothetical protein
MMKYVLYFFVGISLLGAKGCPGGDISPRAILQVKSTSARDLSPSSTPLLSRTGSNAAAARVIAHAHGSQFQAVVADSAGTTVDKVARVFFQKVVNTDLVELRTDLTDKELAAKVVNAVAAQLAEDFRADTEATVRVVQFARTPMPGKKE